MFTPLRFVVIDPCSINPADNLASVHFGECGWASHCGISQATLGSSSTAAPCARYEELHGSNADRELLDLMLANRGSY
jgi:hypothetical protein